MAKTSSQLHSPRPITIEPDGTAYEFSGERSVMPGLEPEQIRRGIEDADAGRLHSLKEIIAARARPEYEADLSDSALAELSALPVWLQSAAETQIIDHIAKDPVRASVRVKTVNGLRCRNIQHAPDWSDRRLTSSLNVYLSLQPRRDENRNHIDWIHACGSSGHYRRRAGRLRVSQSVWWNGTRMKSLRTDAATPMV